MVIYLKYYRCRCLRWFKYKFMYHEKEKAATGLEPVTAKPFLPNLYLDYFDKLEFVSIRVRNELPTCYCLMHFLTAFSVRIVQNYLQ